MEILKKNLFTRAYDLKRSLDRDPNDLCSKVGYSELTLVINISGLGYEWQKYLEEKDKK